MTWTALFVSLVLMLSVGDASSQNANDFINLFGGIVKQAMIQAAQSEWRKIPVSEVACIEQALAQQRVDVQALIQRGVIPDDPRLGQLRANCKVQVIQQAPQPILAQIYPYVVDGLMLGERLQLDSPTYREYQCNPSEQFPSFTWCQRQRRENRRTGTVLFNNSILHSQDGIAAYINRYIEPATFERGEFTKEIERLSAKYGERARVMRMPLVAGLDRIAVIAQWGKIELEPLNRDALSVLASGKDVSQGLLIDYLGDFTRSAKVGLPVYRIGGGPGYLWTASADQKGRGHLRFLSSNASAYMVTAPPPPPNPMAAREEKDQPQPNGLTNLPLPSTPPCDLTSKGRGYSIEAMRFVISDRVFSIGEDVKRSIKSRYGDMAELADWDQLKGILRFAKLSDFIEQAGVPVQVKNSLCNNYLVSYKGQTVSDNSWFFLARHDGIVPDNWAVVDSIGDHTIDLGRWSSPSQALVVIRQAQSPPTAFLPTLAPGPGLLPPGQVVPNSTLPGPPFVKGANNAGQLGAPKGGDQVAPGSVPQGANNTGSGSSFPESYVSLSDGQVRALGIWLVIAAFGALFLLGLTNKVVIFRDMGDLLLTFAVFIYPFLAIIFVVSLVPKNQIPNVISQGAAVLAALGFVTLVARVFYSSIKANGILIGFVIAIFKLVSSVLLGFLAILGLNAWWKRGSLAEVILGGFSAWALHRFINEDAVREQRKVRSVAVEATS